MQIKWVKGPIGIQKASGGKILPISTLISPYTGDQMVNIWFK